MYSNKKHTVYRGKPQITQQHLHKELVVLEKDLEILKHSISVKKYLHRCGPNIQNSFWVYISLKVMKYDWILPNLDPYFTQDLAPVGVKLPMET